MKKVLFLAAMLGSMPLFGAEGGHVIAINVDAVRTICAIDGIEKWEDRLQEEFDRHIAAIGGPEVHVDTIIFGTSDNSRDDVLRRVVKSCFEKGLTVSNTQIENRPEEWEGFSEVVDHYCGSDELLSDYGVAEGWEAILDIAKQYAFKTGEIVLEPHSMNRKEKLQSQLLDSCFIAGNLGEKVKGDYFGKSVKWVDWYMKYSAEKMKELYKEPSRGRTEHKTAATQRSANRNRIRRRSTKTGPSQHELWARHMSSKK